MYLSEAQEFTSFNDVDALIWKKEGIAYGDWTGGPNQDGSYEHTIRFKTSDVNIFLYKLTLAYQTIVFILIVYSNK